MDQLERKHRFQSLLQFGLALALLVIINVLANARFGNTPLYRALDLTEDKRFTLNEATVKQVRELEAPLFARVLLAGELPADYQRLAGKVEDMLLDFSGENSLLEYEFADPLAGSKEQREERQRNLAEEGVLPVTVYAAASAAERSVTVVYPYVILYYGERTRIVPLLEPALPGVSPAVQINQSETLLEYNLIHAIEGLTNNDKRVIGFTFGHGELPPIRTADLVSELRKDYEIGPVNLDSFATLPTAIELLVVAKPTLPFSDFDAFKLDQYVMNGGKIIWAIDAVGMDHDSLITRNEFYPEPRELGLDDIFFRYGFDLTPVLGLDMTNTKIAVMTGRSASGSNIKLTPFHYHVLSVPRETHPIIKNVNPVDLRFPTVIEIKNAEDPDVKKTVLLQSSDRARRKRIPAPIDLDAQKYDLDQARFHEDSLPFSLLLEGTFTSSYANRLSAANERDLRAGGMAFRGKSVPTSMIVIADGDVLANPVSNGKVQPLGYNKWDKFQYGNKAFMLNAIEYLLNPDGAISARNKKIALRLTNKEAARADAAYWRILNIVLPLLLLAVFGGVFNWLRRRRYARRTAN